MKASKFVPVEQGDSDIILHNMLAEISNVGGRLNFRVATHPNGWVAECKEFPGIITGGGDANPTEQEIYSSVKDAVFAAFNIPADLSKKKELVHLSMKEFSFSALCQS